jgi:hypothetical protein
VIVKWFVENGGGSVDGVEENVVGMSKGHEMMIQFTGPKDEDWELVRKCLGEMIDAIKTDASL